MRGEMLSDRHCSVGWCCRRICGRALIVRIVHTSISLGHVWAELYDVVDAVSEWMSFYRDAGSISYMALSSDRNTEHAEHTRSHHIVSFRMHGYCVDGQSGLTLLRWAIEMVERDDDDDDDDACEHGFMFECHLGCCMFVVYIQKWSHIFVEILQYGFIYSCVRISMIFWKIWTSKYENLPV